MTLDEDIKVAEQHLRALYKQRRELRAAARPRRKRLQGGEVLARVQSGQLLADIAAEYRLSLTTVKDRLYWDIRKKSYHNPNTKDYLECWRERYREDIRVNNTLPPEARFTIRKFWPWTAWVHEGVHCNDPQWSEE